MKKGKFPRIRLYGLIFLVSLTTVLLSAITPIWTQALANFPGYQGSFAGSSLTWPAQGIISQGFRKNRHEGIDIAGPVGTPIVAAASGRVAKAGWDDWGLGNAIEIQHPNGSLSIYGHNQRLLVRKGEQVNSGQIIAYMGSTGNSSGPHLHFEYHPDGRIPVDPMSFLPSSVAGRTPATRIANNQKQQLRPPVVARQALRVQLPLQSSFSNSFQQRQFPAPIQIPVQPPVQQNYIASVSGDTGCRGETVISGETTKAVVKLCREGGQVFYIGQSKQDPSAVVKLPAIKIGTARYRAYKDSFYYFVNPQGVEVWQNGQIISVDSFYTFRP